MYNDSMLSRTQKQFFIGGIYILIALVIAGGVYWSKYRPTCNDGVKNGQEEEVDCGTLACGKACASPVQAIQLQSVQLIKTPVGDFDVAAVLYNPNADFGADNIAYNLIVTDLKGEDLYHHLGNSYILPGQTKYLIQTSIKGISTAVSAELYITGVEWQKIADDPSLNFTINREEFTPSNQQAVYEAVITNQSNFDFDTIDVSMVVTDNSGAIIATNMTNFQTFLSRTDRSIKVIWPFALPADARVKTEVGTNVFNNANFLKRNGTQEKFQQYY